MHPRDQLTPKEIQVATLVWEGLTNRDIAKVIGTTEQVVKNYLRTAFDQAGCLELSRTCFVRSQSWRRELGVGTRARYRRSNRGDGGREPYRVGCGRSRKAALTAVSKRSGGNRAATSARRTKRGDFILRPRTGGTIAI